MITLTVDATGPIRAVRALQRRLGDVGTIGGFLKSVANTIWVRNIGGRFAQSAAESSYRDELPYTMAELDEDFVRWLSGTPDAAWASITEEERRGEMSQMGLSDDIINAISASDPEKVVDPRHGVAIMIGIGDVQKLNSISQLDEAGTYLWQLLEYGTGIYSDANQVILRMGKQIFYDRDGSRSGVLTYVTANPGFHGRHAFMEINGDFHQSDKVTAAYLYKYLQFFVKKYSYKKTK
jgi:hypothetical protein